MDLRILNEHVFTDWNYDNQVINYLGVYQFLVKHLRCCVASELISNNYF